MLPCKNCITLPLCKSLDLHHLVEKCSIIKSYLKATRVSTIRNSDTRKIISYKIYSNLKPSIHRYKLRRLKRFIPHTHTLS